ncbi:MAG TPA: response regulator [Pyrinomonadaceae bacterium]|nr:response regulator [Pyrinomonadaceae bacterium]
MTNNEGDARPHVLVVEDLDWIRALMRDSLEAHGYSVAEARDDREAVASAEHSRPALVLTEEHLPTFDALLLSARTHPALAGVHVAVINPDLEEGSRYGDAHVLPDYEHLEHLLAPHVPLKED